MNVHYSVRIPLLLMFAMFAVMLVGCSETATPEPVSSPAPLAANVGTASAILERSTAGAPSVGEIAPDFSYTMADGSIVTLSELQGRPVIINFWATWCLPCREEMPALNSALQANPDLVVLAINRNETVDAINRFQSELPLDFPLIANSRGDIADRYGVNTLPQSYFINRDGTVGAHHIGVLDEADIAEKVEALQ